MPDFETTKRPDYRPDWSQHPHGMDALGGADPFIMEADGHCQLFVPSRAEGRSAADALRAARKPGPQPALQPADATRPRRSGPQPGNELHEEADPRFPYVLTTFRLTELHCGGVMSRVTPHTAELQPEVFVELPPELADELGIEHLGWATLSTLRGEVEMRAMVTERLVPFQIGGKRVYQIGVPWVFGWEGYARGDVANVLLAISGDANTSIHSTKALTCNLRPGPPRGRHQVRHPMSAEPQPARAGPGGAGRARPRARKRPERDGPPSARRPSISARCATSLIALRRAGQRLAATGWTA